MEPHSLSLSLSFYPPSVCQSYSHSDCGPHTPHSTVKTEVEELSHEVFSPISKLNERNISVSKETPTVLTDFLADLFSCFSVVWLIRAGGRGRGVLATLIWAEEPSRSLCWRHIQPTVWKSVFISRDVFCHSFQLAFYLLCFTFHNCEAVR